MGLYSDSNRSGVQGSVFDPNPVDQSRVGKERKPATPRPQRVTRFLLRLGSGKASEKNRSAALWNMYARELRYGPKIAHGIVYIWAIYVYTGAPRFLGPCAVGQSAQGHGRAWVLVVRYLDEGVLLIGTACIDVEIMVSANVCTIDELVQWCISV